MSHFTVLVIGGNVEKQLEPFQEYDVDNVDPKYLKFCDETEDVTVEWDDMSAEERAKYNDSIEEYAKEYHGYIKNEAGRLGHLQNPNSKWDWWKVGGRWSGFFTLKDGREVDECHAGDVDWSGMRASRRARAEKTWAEAAADDALRYFKYGIEKDETRETFLDRREAIAPFAILKNGEWFEKGRMGWFVSVSDEKPREVWEAKCRELLADLAPETELTLVDCHI